MAFFDLPLATFTKRFNLFKFIKSSTFFYSGESSSSNMSGLGIEDLNSTTPESNLGQNFRGRKNQEAGRSLMKYSILSLDPTQVQRGPTSSNSSEVK